MQHTEEEWISYFDKLAEYDYVVIDNFLSNDDLKHLLNYFSKAEFKKAAIGSSGNEKIIGEIRGDYTHWLDNREDVSLQFLFKQLDEVKTLLNKYCYLSLSSYEFHLALYPIGSFYKKHLDQFSNRNNRMISLILYLNENWLTGDGGELKIYPSHPSPSLIAPLLNRCVMFRSDTLLHEVLEANKPRKSLTGWMLYQPTKLVTIAP